MIPHDTTKPQINPRRLVLDGRENELYELICTAGYVPEEQNFSDFLPEFEIRSRVARFRHARQRQTAFPEALAESCNLTICIVAGRDGLRQEEILYDWDKEEQAEWMQEHLRLAKDMPETERDELMRRARREKWKRDFLILGEMGLAYNLAAQAAHQPDDSAPPILLLDESDKFGASVEDSMLMPLERGLVTMPRLENGFVGVSDWRERPIVVTTSNDLRHKLSAPFVSRHIFSRFATPSLVKEMEILRSRCPNASASQVAYAVKLLDAVRGVAGLEDYPSLRESIDVLNAFERDRLVYLDEETLLRYFCYFVKSGEAQELLKLQLDYLLLAATAFHPVVDMWLAERDSNWKRMLMNNGTVFKTESEFSF